MLEVYQENKRMTTEEVLYLSRVLFDTKKVDLTSLFKLLVEIHNNSINDLQPFLSAVCNELIRYEDKMDEIIEEFEDRIIPKFGTFVRKVKMKQVKNQHDAVGLFKTLRNNLSKICFKNPNLKEFIANARTLEQKSAIMKGLDFVYAVVKGLNGDKVVGVLLTKVLNHYWTADGVPSNELIPDLPMIKSGKKE